MNMKNADYNTDNLYFILLLLVVALGFLSPFAFGQPGPGTNYRNVTVLTTLNVTNSLPVIMSIITTDPITLNAGSTREVQCNVSVRDFDGFEDIASLNATFFDTNATTFGAANDNNDHYTNSSCARISNSTFFSNFSCSFSVFYYANNATTWNCTALALDTKNITVNASNTTTISPLLALNITPGTIDYGNLAVGDISNITTANITNFGNTEINVTVRGYGVVENDDLAMICTVNDIPVDEERFSLNSTDIWPNMNGLTSSNQNISGLDLLQRTDDSPGGEIINSTYWRIRVPISTNPSGTCNGSIVFQAEAY